jgi:GNAT superfamily N-acetyltransferase/pimeloyl-ACP methyl ester carboxylesterase
MLVDLVQTFARDGVRLDGAWRQGAGPSSQLPIDAICLIHGTGSNFYSSTFLEAIANHFVALGCGALTVNTRGHDGISTSSVRQGGGKRLGAAYEVVDDCRHDVHAWLDLLAEKGANRIALIGHSLGAVKAIYALAQARHPRVVALVALSPPRISYTHFAASAQAAAFLETFQRAQALVDEGRPNALMEVQLPLPMAIAAAGYLEKYGPHERYDYLKFIRSIELPLLVAFGELEVQSNMAFQGCPDAVKMQAGSGGSLQVEIVPGADHFYTNKRPELLQLIEPWLHKLANPEPRITIEELDCPAAVALIERELKELNARYPEEEPHPTQPRPSEFRPPDGRFLLLWIDGQPVGCGGIRRWDAATAEIKRMYVDPAYRKRGLGRQILARLEAQARELGYRSLRLETGIRQPEAIGLYEQAGFHKIPCFGEFGNSPLSVCYEKRLQ